ncbi:MAG TPA: Gldg family protein [Phycisphaerales bacterium]|nr:Gldg family protein [Phycisphaerales bacterium]
MSGIKGWLNLSVFLLSVAVIAASVNVVAQGGPFRARFDATKTRAYSLSEQTRLMLQNLEGDWTIALVMTEAQTDRTTRKQIDEVLARFTKASPRVSLMRVDPTDPRTLSEYEALLAQLRWRYRDLVDRYDAALDTGVELFRDAVGFAEQQAAHIEWMVQTLVGSVDDAAQEQVLAALAPLMQQARSLSLLAEQGEEVLDAVSKSRQFDDSSPIPDYDAARSILARALATAANELDDTSEEIRRWLSRADLPREIRDQTEAVRNSSVTMAQRLVAAADPLTHLPPLELASIGRRLASGDAAVVLSPKRAAVIPSDQLFPKSNFKATATGDIAFDQRFRGEQLISAAMRSLLVERMPLVVFVHAEERSLLRPHERQADLVGVANVLRASRFSVREWIVGQMEKPTGEPGQPVVYIVLPPSQRQGFEPSRQERALIASVERLIADGEAIMLNVYPSAIARFNQVDPWAMLAEPFGVRVDTARVIYESVRTGTNETQIQQGVALQEFGSSHPIGRAVSGQQAYFSLPLRVEAGGRHHVLASVPPSSSRWLESNWSLDTRSLPEPQPEQRLTEHAPIVVAAERDHPDRTRPGAPMQRAIVVGSGGWLLSFIADLVVGLGGDRVALVNPGNAELLLASVAWLAGMDQLIAQSAAGQEVSRLRNVSDTASFMWRLLFIGGVPGACLLLGAAVWWRRQS